MSCLVGQDATIEECLLYLREMSDKGYDWCGYCISCNNADTTACKLLRESK